MSTLLFVRNLLLRGGTLLGASAILSKCLGLLRDRLLVEIFGQGDKVDLIFASFRIPDFFFALLIGGTVSTLFLPRVAHLEEEKKYHFLSSFLWGVVVLFGIFCGLGVFFTDSLIVLFAGGFDVTLRAEMVPLARCLFGSVFLLAVSAVFSAFQQSYHRFISISIAPILYTGMICAGLFWWRDQWGLMTVGLAALAGATLHLLSNAYGFFAHGGQIHWTWKTPTEAWQGFKRDFFYRVLNNSAFQINQTADILIASFLITGSVTAFSLGSNLGFVLLSVVGFAIANSAFPKLSHAKHDYPAQKEILKTSIQWVLFFTIPTVIVGMLFASPILHLLFHLEGEMLRMATTVFFWTILALPATCIIPTLSRVFLANDDALTPMKVSTASLLVATGAAAMLSLVILPSEKAILGLALGNLIASGLSAILFGWMLWAQYFCKNKEVKCNNIAKTRNR
ncbi:oligosaccharide flippase family protein [Candidatus Gracilibacteria bacterium]|nr:oligosaccharide flippase family protein [Candidatus Gracilibacteria bacterium]